VSLTIEARIGKKYALYLPKAIVEAIGLREGERVLLRTTGNTVLIETIEDPIKLALTKKKFASVEPGQVEAISLEEQTRHIKNSP
jgi:AbrB family looped-hinge helix DNA binding protein